MYRIGDQLYVQPDARLAQSFAAHERVRMSRPEVAVARSPIEVWETISAGAEARALVLDVNTSLATSQSWFGAAPRAPSAHRFVGYDSRIEVVPEHDPDLPGQPRLIFT